MPTYSLDIELAKDIRRMVRRFPENFDFIDPTDILPITVSDNTTLSKYAEVKKIPPYIRAAMKFKVAMLVYDEMFWDQPRRVRDLIIIHELEHIWPDEKEAGEYKLREHSVQDFTELLDALGHGWVRRVKANPGLDIRNADGGNWKTALDQLSNNKRKKKRRGNKNIKRRKRRRIQDAVSTSLQGRPDSSSRD